MLTNNPLLKIGCFDLDIANQINSSIAALNTVGNGLFGPVALNNGVFIRIAGSNLATGDNDLYTVPANKRLVLGNMNGVNTSAGNITFFAEVKSGSTYYRLSAGTTIATTASNAAFCSIALEAGDILAVNVATTSGLNVNVMGMLMDSSVSLKTYRLLGLATGNNTLYTVPANKSAMILPNQTGVPFSPGSGVAPCVADSGGTRTFTFYSFATGGSAASASQVTAGNAVSASGRTNVSIPLTLAAGDSIVVGVDTGAASQVAWVNVVEI